KRLIVSPTGPTPTTLLTQPAVISRGHPSRSQVGPARRATTATATATIIHGASPLSHLLQQQQQQHRSPRASCPDGSVRWAYTTGNYSSKLSKNGSRDKRVHWINPSLGLGIDPSL